jgi:hypothetical protein
MQLWSFTCRFNWTQGIEERVTTSNLTAEEFARLCAIVRKVVTRDDSIQSTIVSFPSYELFPPPSSHKRVCVPSHLDPVGRTYSLGGEGVGGANSDDRPDTLALCILCDCEALFLRCFPGVGMN